MVLDQLKTEVHAALPLVVQQHHLQHRRHLLTVEDGLLHAQIQAVQAVQCCMQVMGVTMTTTIPPPTTAGGGYGPQIDLDIDLGNLENPIDDIDLGEGTGVDRPSFIKNKDDHRP